MHKYKTRIKMSNPEFSTEGWTKKQLEKDGFNFATDAYLIVSVLDTTEGGTSTLAVGRDGRNGGDDISEMEIFKIWVMLAHRLMQNLKTGTWQRQLTAVAFEGARKIVTSK